MSFWEDLGKIGGAIAAPLVLGATALGGGAKILGDIFSSNAESDADLANAHAVEQQAGFSRLATDQNLSTQVVENARQLGSIRAAYGASGVKLDGSAQDVQDFAAGLNRMKLLNIEMKGAAEQYAYGNTIRNYNTGADNAETAKWLNIANDVAGSAGKVFASTYRGYKPDAGTAPLPAGTGGGYDGTSNYASGGW
jgi:hypothetical protein